MNRIIYVKWDNISSEFEETDVYETYKLIETS